MVKDELLNKVGLHARPAAALVQLARRYQSKVTLEKDGERADAKSIMGILTLAIGPGSNVVLEVCGSDERECFDELSAFIINGIKE